MPKNNTSPLFTLDNLIENLVDAGMFKTKKEAHATVDAITFQITEALADERTVSIHMLGKIIPVVKPERQGLHPQTKEPMMFKAHVVVKFKAGEQLLKQLKP